MGGPPGPARPDPVREVVVDQHASSGGGQFKGRPEQVPGFRRPVGVEKIAQDHQAEAGAGPEGGLPEVASHPANPLPVGRFRVEASARGQDLREVGHHGEGPRGPGHQVAAQGPGAAAGIQDGARPAGRLEHRGDLQGLAV